MRVWSWLASKQRKYNTESLNSVSVLRVYKEGERKTNLRPKGVKELDAGTLSPVPHNPHGGGTGATPASCPLNFTCALWSVCYPPPPHLHKIKQINVKFERKGKHFEGIIFLWKIVDFLILGGNLNLDTCTVYFWGWLNPHSPNNLLRFCRGGLIKKF